MLNGDQNQVVKFLDHTNNIKPAIKFTMGFSRHVSQTTAILSNGSFGLQKTHSYRTVPQFGFNPLHIYLAINYSLTVGERNIAICNNQEYPDK